MESVRSIGKFKYNSIESEDKTLEIFTEDFSKGTNYNKVLLCCLLHYSKTFLLVFLLFYF